MKLTRNLFFYAFILVLSLSACKKSGGDKAVTGKAAGDSAKSEVAATMFKINPTTSQVLWVGSKPGGQHTGTIGVAEGFVGINGKDLVSGQFTLDMNSITVTDLKAGEGKEDLEGHLKGTIEGREDHFFNVAKYPTANFKITNVGPATAGDQSANATITGDLTLLSTTKSISIPAFVGVIGDKFTAVTPNFKIDRTEWGINFQSKTVFDDLKDKFIDDEISLTIQLEANKG